MDPPSTQDQQWLHAVFDRFHRPLVAYALRLNGGNIEAARDCVQETFLALCQQPRSAVSGHVDAWLFKSCRNRVIDHHRRETSMASYVKKVKDSADQESSGAQSLHPSQVLADQEDRELLTSHIRQLPERQQEVLALRLSDGLSYKQIAEIMGLSVSHVGVLLHEAVVHLRDCLSIKS